MSDPFAPSRLARGRATAESQEIDRICALPVVELPDPAACEALSREVVQAEAFERGFRLNAYQVGALLAWELYGGVFGPIPVGGGKEYTSVLVPDQAFRAGTCKRALLLVPPHLVGALLGGTIPAARRLFGLRIPILALAGREAQGRGALARSGKSGLYVSTYSLLSARDAEQILADIAPDLVILNEAQRVKRREAARTRRLLRMFERVQPRVVVLSGTITTKSVMDYHHLIAQALREHSPIPTAVSVAQGWAEVVDAGAGEDPGASRTGPIAPLVDWARREYPLEELPRGLPGFRAAFRLRLNSAPGVVSSGGLELGTSLTIRNVPVEPANIDPAENAALLELQRQVTELWRSPSGDDIEHGMHMWRYLYELAAGFYYRLRWPSPEELAARRSLDADEAAAYVEAAQKHHEARQEFNRRLRRWIDQRGRPGLDTPLLVEANMARKGAEDVGADLFKVWREAKDLEFDGMPTRLSEPVRVCRWKVAHVARLAAEEREAALKEGTREGVLVWYWHAEVGRWLTEELERLGVPTLWCPADSVRPGSSMRLMTNANAGHVIVLSTGGHREGHNLQGHEGHPGFERQILAEFPRSADHLEQLLGRTHRTGQLAEELVPLTVNTDEFDHENLSACLIDALYIHQTTGTRQKAIYASYDPLPRIYPPDFLRERGFADVAHLDAQTRAALEDKFGPLTAPAAKR